MPAIKQLHEWNVTPREAVAIQNELRGRIVRSPLRRMVETVAGADVSFDRPKNKLYAAIAVLRFPSLDLIEQVAVEGEPTFPYVPGLLSFREIPIVTRAFERLSGMPDVLMCDGQGLAHPRGFGLACHLGLLLGIPTVGCAKSRLCGEHGAVGPEVGDYAPLKLGGRTVGAVLRTRRGVKPIFVSVGHMIDLRGAVRLALKCGGGYRIPEPTRAAHHLVTAARLGTKESWPTRKR